MAAPGSKSKAPAVFGFYASGLQTALAGLLIIASLALGLHSLLPEGCCARKRRTSARPTRLRPTRLTPIRCRPRWRGCELLRQTDAVAQFAKSVGMRRPVIRAFATRTARTTLRLGCTDCHGGNASACNDKAEVPTSPAALPGVRGASSRQPRRARTPSSTMRFAGLRALRQSGGSARRPHQLRHDGVSPQRGAVEVRKSHDDDTAACSGEPPSTTTARCPARSALATAKPTAMDRHAAAPCRPCPPPSEWEQSNETGRPEASSTRCRASRYSQPGNVLRIFEPRRQASSPEIGHPRANGQTPAGPSSTRLSLRAASAPSNRTRSRPSSASTRRASSTPR